MANGKCEVNIENDCAWIMIYERLKAQGRLAVFKKISPPKDYSIGVKPRMAVVESRKQDKRD